MPPPAEAAEWLVRLEAAEVVAKLRERMFAMENWHQTLSGRHFDADAETITRLMRAGERIRAQAVTFRLNRVRWSRGVEGARNHCELLPQGRPQGFDSLLSATQDALRSVGLGDDEGHRPHLTLSYAAEEIHPVISILPIEWTIDEVMLLKGQGTPYRYEVLGRWPLLPSSPRHQDDLFALG